LLDIVLDFTRSPNTPAQQPAPQQPQPQQPVAPPVAPPVQQQTTPTDSLLKGIAPALIASGAIQDQGGFYVAGTPELAQVAAALNQEILKGQQDVAARQAMESINPVINELKQQITTLREELKSSTPKEHEAWLNQHQEYLYTKDATGRLTNAMSPAGALYDQVWTNLEAQGVTDERVLHQAAQTAVTGYWKSLPPMPSAPAAPQPTFMQAAASSNLPHNPGFNLPGSIHNVPGNNGQQPLFVTNQGMADWNAISNAMANGTIQ
jgi:hypothetical protein